jgi:hypothetical protein
MEPASPVIPGANLPEVTYAKDQPDYIPLPVLRTPEGQVTSRWKFTDEERKAVADGADLFVSVLTFNHPLQPMLVGVAKMDVSKPLENIDAVAVIIGTSMVPFGAGVV